MSNEVNSKGFYEWLKFSGLVTFGAFVVWKYYQYHERRIKLKENDDEEMYRRSNILNTVNDVIVPWFTIINDLKGKYPVPQLKYKINNVTLSFSKYELIDIVQRTHDVKQFRFKLEEDESLQIPLGTHLQIQNDRGVKRPYTPISSLKQKGYFDLLIKKYEEGKVSSYMHSLKIGDKVEIRGPLGGVKLNLDVQNIGMIAAGTGITPIAQLLINLSEQPHANLISVTLLFANKTENDILLQEELYSISNKFKSFRVIHVLSRSGEKRHIDGEILKSSLVLEVDHIYICGSLEFSKSMKEHLEALQYSSENITTF